MRVCMCVCVCVCARVCVCVCVNKLCGVNQAKIQSKFVVVLQAVNGLVPAQVTTRMSNIHYSLLAINPSAMSIMLVQSTSLITTADITTIRE